MHYLTEPRYGAFFLRLCTEPDQAIFTTTFNQLSSDPVETPGNLAAIVCVLVTVKSFKEEHPLISAEMNGLSGR